MALIERRTQEQMSGVPSGRRGGVLDEIVFAVSMATMQHPAFYHQEHDGRVGRGFDFGQPGSQHSPSYPARCAGFYNKVVMRFVNRLKVYTCCN